MAVAKTTNTGSAGTRRTRGAVGTPALRPARPVLGFANGSWYVCLTPASISLHLFYLSYSGPDIIHAMELKMRFNSLSIPRVPRDAMYVNEEAAALAHRSGLSGTPPELVFICMYPSAHIFSGIVTKFDKLLTICIIHCINYILVFDGYSSYICVPQPRPNGTLSGRETLIANSGAFCSAWIPEARIFCGVHFRKALRKVS